MGSDKIAITETGLPVPLVRAVLHGHYVFKDGKAVVDVPAMLLRRARWRW